MRSQHVNVWPFYNSSLTLPEALQHLIKDDHKIKSVTPIEFRTDKGNGDPLYGRDDKEVVTKAIIISEL